MARLPSELLLHIIGSLIPTDPPVAFPSSHSVTRTLLSLCLVSRTLHHAAVRHLFAHCAYIDSPDRLRLLQQTLLAHDDGRTFGYSTIPRHRDEPRDHEAGRLSNVPTNEPPKPPPPLIKSLFLSPFPPTTISVPSTASSILTLLTRLGPYLTRLVIDISLRSLYPEDDHDHEPQIRPTLLAAFQSLTALEEFTSTRDELFLAVVSAGADADAGRNWHDLSDVAVWSSSWPKLQRLALYNVDVSASAFLRDVQRCRNLTHLVLTRADGLAERTTASSSSSSTSTAPELPSLPHLQRVLVVNTAPSHASRRAFSRRRWKDCFLGTVWNLVLMPRRGSAATNGLQVARIDVPVRAGCGAEDGEEDGPIERCQEWVRDAAIQGTLWDAAGAAVLVVKPDLDAEDSVGGVGVGVSVSWQPASLADGPASVESESD